MEECSNNAGSLLSSEEPRDAKALDENNKQISKDDLLCLACKELLVRPVVLNCGHGIITFLIYLLLLFLPLSCANNNLSSSLLQCIVKDV